MKSTRDLVLQGGILLILVEAVTSISISCGPDSFFRAPQWNCDVCGDNFLLGSSPIVCAPANATFDDIPVGPVGEYQRINWTNFENTVNKVPFVKPASAANFAKLPAGKRGIITFDLQSDPDRPQRFGGFLSSFRYACALPLTSIPISCSVKVAETCETIAADGFGRVTQTSITNFRYNASLTSGLVRSSSYPPYTYFCTNATFSAKSVLGTPVDLYVDEVLHGVFKSRFFDSEV